MGKKLEMRFKFFDCKEDAERLANKENVEHPRRKQKHKAHISPWSSSDGKENKWLCFYYC